MVAFGVNDDYRLIDPDEKIRPVGSAFMKERQGVAAPYRVTRPYSLSTIKRPGKFHFKRIEARVSTMK